MKKAVIIAGAGTHSGFSPALAEALLKTEREVFLLVRREETKHQLLTCFENRTKTPRCVVVDLLKERDTYQLLDSISEEFQIDVLVHNAARFKRAPFSELGLLDFEEIWRANVGTAIPASNYLAEKMAQNGGGSIIYSGATASVRGGANFSAFASAKFALRGLSQSLAREYGKRGVHVAHVLLDGIIWGDRAQNSFGIAQGRCIQPEELASAYLSLIGQPTSCWTQELDLRPAQENF